MRLFRSLPALLLLLAPGLRADPAVPLPVLAAHLKEYAHKTYPCQVTSVTATAAQLTVHGRIGTQTGPFALAEIRPWENLTELTDFTGAEAITPAPDGTFTVTRPRPAPVEGSESADRLFSRWAIVRGNELLSHARYVDQVKLLRGPLAPRPALKSRKGIGGFSLGNPISDLDDLGLGGATVNVTLSSIMRTTGGPGRTPFLWRGQTWYTEDKTVDGLDRNLLELQNRHLTAAAIILVPRPPKNPADQSYNRLIGHPDNNGGIYSMPNLTSVTGLNAYVAALEFLAQRYTQPDGAHGRIHDWIMFNEVDSAFSWANAGDKPDWVYTDLLVKALRIAHLTVRQYDPGANVFVSLDQHWTASPGAHCFPGRTVLEHIADWGAAEGDFPWAVAHHPYPQSLGDPKVWENDKATFAFNTPKITFKNLEVLCAYLDQPRFLFLGKVPRRLQLTEQGLNAKDYSDHELEMQAAGMAYTWNKIKRLPRIELFDYHNWIDNRGEGGLRIGLRRFRDDETDPSGRKPIWWTYQACGTPGEAAMTDFAKPIVGVTDWAEIMYRGEIK